MTFSETPQLQPITPAYHLRILNDAQLAQFKSATLEILQEAGIYCPSDRALEIYAGHGAQVDFGTKTVKIPAEVVLRCLSQAPRGYTMGARSPAHDLHLDGTSFFCATDGCGVEVIDFTTRERRPSRKEDVAQTARLADALASIGFYWPVVSAQDFPRTAPLQELEAAFTNTVKHVQSETVMGMRMAHYAVDMAQVIAGDSASLHTRPPLSLLVCCISPLMQDRDGMESALTFAEAGLPVGFMSMVHSGSTAPATLAGTIAQGDAEIVSALVLVQMAHPGAPVFHSLMPGLMQPRSGAFLTTSWEGELPYGIGVELAHQWGVPSLAGVYGTDAPMPGWQAAEESATALMLAVLAGAETGSGMGLLEACTLLYPEQLILDSDIYQRVRLDAQGLDTSAEALALEVIKAVGPRGQFLRHRHTRNHLRQRVYSDLTGQASPAGGFQDPLEVAREKVADILMHHQPEPLPESQRRELKRILSLAEREFI